MGDKVDVMNRALEALGNEVVADLSEASQDRSNALVKLLRVADAARDRVLRRHGWKCALEYTQLAPVVIANYTNWKFPVTYELPGNGLRVWLVEGCREDAFGGRWELGTLDQDRGARVIIRSRDNRPALNVAYIRRASWEALDMHLADAVGLTCAGFAAYSITGDKGLGAQILQQAEKIILENISVDATQEEGGEVLAPDIPWTLRRMAGESAPLPPYFVGGGGGWPGG